MNELEEEGLTGSDQGIDSATDLLTESKGDPMETSHENLNNASEAEPEPSIPQVNGESSDHNMESIDESNVAENGDNHDALPSTSKEESAPIINFNLELMDEKQAETAESEVNGLSPDSPKKESSDINQNVCANGVIVSNKSTSSDQNSDLSLTKSAIVQVSSGSPRHSEVKDETPAEDKPSTSKNSSNPPISQQSGSSASQSKEVSSSHDSESKRKEHSSSSRHRDRDRDRDRHRSKHSHRSRHRIRTNNYRSQVDSADILCEMYKKNPPPKGEWTPPRKEREPWTPHPQLTHMKYGKYFRIVVDPNGGASVCHLYWDEIEHLDKKVIDEISLDFIKLTYSEDSNECSYHVMGIVHAAAAYLPDLVDYMADHYGQLTCQVGSLTGRDTQSVTMAQYRDEVYKSYNNGTFRYGPLQEVSLCGVRREEVGAYFPDFVARLEQSPCMKPVMPWSKLSYVATDNPRESNDGPICWVRPGEQTIGASNSAGRTGRIAKGVSRLCETREALFEDRTKPHADQIGIDGGATATAPTAAVGVLKAVVCGHPEHAFRATKHVIAFDAKDYVALIDHLQLDVYEPPLKQCRQWLEVGKLNSLRRIGIRFASIELDCSDVYYIPRKVVHQFQSISAVASIAWHVRWKDYFRKTAAPNLHAPPGLNKGSVYYEKKNVPHYEPPVVIKEEVDDADLEEVRTPKRGDRTSKTPSTAKRRIKAILNFTPEKNDMGVSNSINNSRCYYEASETSDLKNPAISESKGAPPTDVKNSGSSDHKSVSTPDAKNARTPDSRGDTKIVGSTDSKNSIDSHKSSDTPRKDKDGHKRHRHNSDKKPRESSGERHGSAPSSSSRHSSSSSSSRRVSHDGTSSRRASGEEVPSRHSSKSSHSTKTSSSESKRRSSVTSSEATNGPTDSQKEGQSFSNGPSYVNGPKNEVDTHRDHVSSEGRQGASNDTETPVRDGEVATTSSQQDAAGEQEKDAGPEKPLQENILLKKRKVSYDVVGDIMAQMKRSKTD